MPDPNLTLGPQPGQFYGPDLKQILTLQALQQRMQMQRQEIEGQNALRALYRDPNNVNPGTFALKPEAIGRLMQANPLVGQDYIQTLSRAQEQRARQQQITSKTFEELRKEGRRIQGDSLQIYDDALKYGSSAEQAKARSQENYTQEVQQLRTGGGYSPEMINQIPLNFDPVTARARVLDYDQRLEQDRLKRTEGRQERAEGREEATATSTIQHQRAMEEQGRWTVKDDPTTGRPYMVNTKTGETKPVAPPGGQTTAAEASDLHGEEYLKTLEPNQQTQVKALSEGRMAFPSGFALRSPYWQRMLQQVAQYDPDFNASDYNRRAQTMRAFTTGPEARNVTSFNTALGHLSNLRRSADDLLASEALGGGFKPFNVVEQTVRGVTGGDAKIKRFSLDAQALASEMERAFRGTGGNVTEIEALKQKMSSVDTPQTMNAVIKEASNLLASRIEAINETYRRGMGSRHDVGELLTPRSRSVWDAIQKGETPPKEGLGKEGEKQSGPTTGTQTMPTPGADGIFAPKSEEEFTALPSGAAFRKPGDPPDKVRIKP